MKKSLKAVALVLGFSMLAAGCGSSSDSGSEGNAGSADSAVEAEENSSSSAGVDQAIVDKYVLSYGNNNYYNMLVPDWSVMSGETTTLNYLELCEQEIEDNPWADIVLFSQGDSFEETQGVDAVREKLADPNVVTGLFLLTDMAYKVNAVSGVTYTAASTSESTNAYGFSYILESGTATLTYDPEHINWDYHERAGNEETSLDFNYAMIIIENGKDYDGNFGVVLLDLSDE